MKNKLIICLSIILFVGCINNKSKDNLTKLNYINTENTVSKVTLKHSNRKYQIFVDNVPFYIKGAGLEFGNISALAKHNGNSMEEG